MLHAYEGEPGPLEVIAEPRSSELEVQVSDQGKGFRPHANDGDPSLGLGLPLIAALSDSFEISGGAGHGSRTTIRFGFVPPEFNNNGTPTEAPEELEMAITPGEIAKPVLARVIGALAARAELSVDRLADTVLLGDAVSSSEGVDFAEGRLGISIKDGDGTLHVRVGPLIEGAGAEADRRDGASRRAVRCAPWPPRWRSPRARPPRARQPSSWYSKSPEAASSLITPRRGSAA